MTVVPFVLATCMALQTPPASPATPPPDKLALIVAVANYPEAVAKTLPDLHGSRNDAEQARELLVSRFGFDPGEILVLIDEAATHEAVVRAFHEHLITRAGPGTEVVFWYSGHGAQIPDASGFEASGFDSTLVLSDSRSASYDGEYDLSDDELSTLLDALARTGANALIVTDACHSGGGTRGGQRQSKSAPRGSRSLAAQLIAPFWPKDVEMRDDDGERRDRPGFVHIAACSTRQEAQERPFPLADGTLVLRGCLTHGLCWFLNAAQPGDTFRSVADRTALWVEGFEPDQTPQCEGALDRELFSGRFAARPRGFEARLADGRELTISAGRVQGIRPGTEFTIVDPAGARLGIAGAAVIGACETAALWYSELPDAARGVALRALPIAGTGGREPLQLRVSDAILAKLLAERFTSRLTIADAGMQDAYRLEIAEAGGEGPAVNCRFDSPDGIPLWHAEYVGVAGGAGLAETGAFERFATELEAALEHEAVHRELTALPSEPGTLRLTGTLTPPDAGSLDRLHRGGVKNAVAAKIEIVAGAAGVARTYRAQFDPAGTDLPVAELTVENLDREPVHVTVVSVSEDRNRAVIYPDEGVRDEVLPAGGTRTFAISLNGDAQRRFSREIRDRILLIATRVPVDFFALSGTTTYRSESAPPVLERVFRGSKTRGGGGNDDFGVAAIDIWVPGMKP